MSSTTGQPRNRRYIRVSQQRKTSCAGQNIVPSTKTYNGGASAAAVAAERAAAVRAAAVQVRTCVCRRGRFPQALDLWRKSASIGYRVGRVSQHAVSRWSRSPSCCGYMAVCFFSVLWDLVFSVFFTSNAHGLLQVRGTLPHVPLYHYRGAYRVPLFN